MRNAKIRLQLLFGLIPAALGAGALAGAVLFPAWLARHAPGLGHIGVDAALCFLLCGAGLLAAGGQRPSMRRLQAAAGAAAALIGALALLQATLDYSPLVARWPAWLTPRADGTARPGGMCPPLALGFAFAGLALMLLTRLRGTAMVVTHGLGVAVVGLALICLFSGALDSVLFYSQQPWRVLVSIPAVLGLAAIGAGLYLASSRACRLRSFYHGRGDRKIFVTGIALFTLISLVAGLIGIGVVGRYAMNNFQDALWASFRSNTELFHASLDGAVARGAEIVRLSDLERMLAGRATPAELQREVERVVAVAGYDELSYLTIASAAGRTLARTGSGSFSDQFSVRLPFKVVTRLYWQDGWRLLMRVPLGDAGPDAPYATLEVSLRRFDRQFARMNLVGASGETRVCASEGGAMHCFPSRLLPEVSHFPLAPRDRLRASERALGGERGVGGQFDYRGREVIAAYGSVENTGLAVVQKVDADEFYRPLRRQLWCALAGLALLIVAGAAVLYWRTRPLVNGLVRMHARLDALLDNVPAGVLTVDAGGVIRSANRTAAELFGYRAEQLVGLQCGQLLCEDERPLRRPRLGLQALRALRRDGAVFRAEVIASEFRHGAQTQRIAIIQDVSARHAMESQLQRWRHVFEHAGWGIAIGGADGGGFELINPAFARMHGYTVDELAGRPIADVSAPETRAGLAAHVGRARQAGRHSFESCHLRKDGRAFPVWVDVSAVRDRRGEVLYHAINVLDISERKRMEQDLRHSEQLLREILDALPVGVWVANAHGRIGLSNPMGRRIWHGAVLDGADWGVARALGGGESAFDNLIDIAGDDGARKIIRYAVVPLVNGGARQPGALIVGEDITAARRAEQALKHSQADLANAQRIAHIGSWQRELGADAGYLHWSDETYRILGFAPGAIAPDYRIVRQLVHPDDRARFERCGRDALAGAPYDVTMRMVLADGTQKVLRSLAQVVPGEDGRPAHLQGTVQDITEKTQAEQLLRKREEAFRELVENSPDVTLRFDRDLRCVYINPAVESAIGLRPARIIGKTIGQLRMAQQSAAQWSAAIRKVFDSELTDTFEFSFPSAAGARHYQVRLVPEFRPRGEMPTVLAIARDISAIKHGEAVLRESQQRLHGITANMPGMVFQCQLDAGDLLRFTYVSEGAGPLFGVAREDIEADADAITRRIVEPDRERFCASLRASAASLEMWNWEGRALRLDGEEIWINCRATPRAAGADTIWEGGMFNITGSKRNEQELQQSRQWLRALSAHMEAVREEERKKIAREVHDELGQALTVLRMDVSLLRLNFGGQSPRLMERLLSMKQAVDRTIHIVRHVTSALRPAALDLGLTAALEWLVEDFTSHSTIDCELRTNEEYEVVLDDGQTTALFRIVQESLTNVLKHASASEVHVSLQVEDGQIRLEVRDNGGGFAAGAGRRAGAFGLMGMRERALMLGGNADIRSAVGRGTSVLVRLPLKTRGAQAPHTELSQ